jgi:hypothetical protein
MEYIKTNSEYERGYLDAIWDFEFALTKLKEEQVKKISPEIIN